MGDVLPGLLLVGGKIIITLIVTGFSETIYKLFKNYKSKITLQWELSQLYWEWRKKISRFINEY